jgi:hypothetical protein
MDASNIKIVLSEVEKDLVDEIVANLKRNAIDYSKAQALAKEFLSRLPQNDFEGLLSILKSLAGKYEEANSVYIKYQAVQSKIEDEEKAKLIVSHLVSGNVEKALETAKGGQSG